MTPLHPLTSLRFFGAFAVLAMHGARLSPFQDSIHTFLSNSVCVLTFFFVLSGFVLSYVYASSIGTLERKTVFSFWIARFARIYPVHLLGFVLCIFLTYEGTLLLDGDFGPAFQQAIRNLTLMQAYSGDPLCRKSFNAPSWSMSVEWSCYFFFPFLIAGLTSRSWFLRIFVSLIASAGFAWGWYRLMTLGSAHPSVYQLASFPPVRMFDFFCGCLLGLTFRKWQAVQKEKEHSLWRWTAIEAAGVLSLIGCLSWAGTEDLSLGNALGWNGFYVPSILSMVWIFALGRGYLSRLLSTSFLVRLGESCYSLYMFHFAAIMWLLTIYGDSAEDVKPLWLYPAFLLGMTAFSLVAYRRFEIPSRNWLRARLTMKEKVTVEELPSEPIRRAA